MENITTIQFDTPDTKPSPSKAAHALRATDSLGPLSHPPSDIPPGTLNYVMWAEEQKVHKPGVKTVADTKDSLAGATELTQNVHALAAMRPQAGLAQRSAQYAGNNMMGACNIFADTDLADLPYEYAYPEFSLDGSSPPSADDKRRMLQYYLINLYPATPIEQWLNMSYEELRRFYVDTDFWYAFNDNYLTEPVPKTLDNDVNPYLEKGYFYHPDSALVSSYPSLGINFSAGFDEFHEDAIVDGEVKAVLKNRGPLRKRKIVYYKDGQKYEIDNINQSLDYFENLKGSYLEFNGWGWHGYPQGTYPNPSPGSGIFVNIPERTEIGYNAWHIIEKSTLVDKDQVYFMCYNHDLFGLQTGGYLALGNTPPANAWNGKSWTYVAFGEQWGKGKDLCWNPRWKIKYYLSHQVVAGKPTVHLTEKSWYSAAQYDGPDAMIPQWLIKPDDWRVGTSYAAFKPFADQDWLWQPRNMIGPIQSAHAGYVNDQIAKGHKEYEEAWPTMEWYTGKSGTKYIIMAKNQTNMFMQSLQEVFAALFDGGYPSWYTTAEIWNIRVVNYTDDLMYVMATGNFSLPQIPFWPNEELPNVNNYPQFYHDHYGFPETLSKYQDNPLNLEDVEAPGDAKQYVIRTMMPNTNGDIAAEMADLRVAIPGLLVDGSGNQETFKKMFQDWISKYVSVRDPFDLSRYIPMTEELAAPWYPDTSLVTATKETGYVMRFDPTFARWTFDLPTTGMDGKTPDIYKPCTCKVGEWYTDVSLTKCCDSPNCRNGSVGGSACNKGDYYNCLQYQRFNKTVLCEGEQFFRHNVDTFATGFASVPFQWGPMAYVSTYSISGTAHIQWGLPVSKLVAWDPLNTRVNANIMRNGVKMIKNLDRKLFNPILPLWAVIIIGLVVTFATVYTVQQKYWYHPKKNMIIGGAAAGLVLFYVLLYFLGRRRHATRSKIMAALPAPREYDNKLALETYLSSVYPLVKRKVWTDLSEEKLANFFLKLHVWYRSGAPPDSVLGKQIAMPSPMDYLDANWRTATNLDEYYVPPILDLYKKFVHPDNEAYMQPPMGKGSKWATFCTRRWGPQPPIVFNGRELCTQYVTFAGSQPVAGESAKVHAVKEGIAKSPYFGPSSQLWMDTFTTATHFAASGSNNEDNLDAWDKLKYMETSTSYMCFPDGAYFDWMPGTGVFVKLGNHVSGYNAYHVCLRAMHEGGLTDEDLRTKDIPQWYKDMYEDEWQKTLGKQPIPMSFLYGSLVGTQEVVETLSSSASNTPANGFPYRQTGDFATFSVDKWVAGEKLEDCWLDGAEGHTYAINKPGYVIGYPFPLPFPDGKTLNMDALKIPMMYQLYNMQDAIRTELEDLKYIDPEIWPTHVVQLVDDDKWARVDVTDRAQFHFYVEYVDWASNQAAWRKTPMSRKEVFLKYFSLDGGLYANPITYPFRKKYPRLSADGGKGPSRYLDGPLVSLKQENNPYGFVDSKRYPYEYNVKGSLQLRESNLECDHIMGLIRDNLGYDSLARVKHANGNISQCMGVEVSHSFTVPGSLFSSPTENIYNLWKKLEQKGWLILGNPFDPDFQPFQENFEDIYTVPRGSTSSSTVAKRRGPPYIECAQLKDLPNYGFYSMFGWGTESAAAWTNTMQVSYLPCNSIDIPYSHLEWEVNRKVFAHQIKEQIGMYQNLQSYVKKS